MYVKIVDPTNQDAYVYASPGTIILECDEVRYNRICVRSKSEFDEVMAEHVTERGRYYEVYGSEPKYDEMENFVILGLITYQEGNAIIPSPRTIVTANERVYIMNGSGKTIDCIFNC